MPNDLYRWEDAGAGVHHCPKCFKPLDRPQARTICLGKHVECCKKYHTQLFNNGTSSTCLPCRKSDKEHLKRHREIAEVLSELKHVKEAQAAPIPTTPQAQSSGPDQETPSTDPPMTKKERKTLKRAKKMSEMKKVVTGADIAFVATVLHPGDSEDEAFDIERQLLSDPDFKINRSYHKGTSNVRMLRKEFIQKDKDKRAVQGDNDFHLDHEEWRGLLQLLNVSPLAQNASAEEKSLHAKLQACIQSDIQHVQQEEATTMMRKAGFWRWASKKVYNRLVQNGRIWSQKEPGGSTPRTASDASETTSDTKESIETDVVTETDTDLTTPSEEDAEEDATVAAVVEKLAIEEGTATDSPKTPTPCNVGASDNDTNGWTTVGRAPKTEAPKGSFQLVRNGGLAKMASPITPARRRYRGFAVSYE